MGLVVLTTELFWLLLTIVLTGFLWMPYVINRFQELGPPTFNWYPPATLPPNAAWAERAIMAHRNAVENLVVFAPLVIMVYLSGKASTVTGLACMVYFYARCAHYMICVLGFPIAVRTIVFLISISCQVALIVSLLR